MAREVINLLLRKAEILADFFCAPEKVVAAKRGVGGFNVGNHFTFPFLQAESPSAMPSKRAGAEFSGIGLMALDKSAVVLSKG